MKKIGVIFDLDGVIFNNNPYHKKAWEEFCNRYDIFISQEALENNVFGQTNSDVLEYLFRRKLTRHEVHDLGEVKEKIYREIFNPHVKPLEGLMPFLDELKSNDVPIGMATSAPKSNIDFLLDKVDIRGYFKSIIDDEGVTQGKPHPEIFQKCMAALKIEPNNCLVFEDSISGINSALNAGTKVIALTTTHESSEFSGVEMAIANFTGMNLKTIRKVLSK